MSSPSFILAQKRRPPETPIKKKLAIWNSFRADFDIHSLKKWDLNIYIYMLFDDFKIVTIISIWNPAPPHSWINHITVAFLWLFIVVNLYQIELNIIISTSK